MRSPEIRESFLQFFEQNGHLRLPSASLVPQDDPSLLFTVAGMVPLKAYLSGEKPPPNRRLTSAQKCFRGSGLTTDDITAVGDDTHHTFFEMLGNWSIGEYFKEGAIVFAWELLTDRFGLEPDLLWPSIYPDDADSEKIWRDKIGVPAERITRFTDNWWQAGPTGPCGYDSEVYYDLGGPCSCGRTDCRPDDECGGNRWVEIWNLVFMEFNQAEDGTRTPLPAACVDTGMGLERIAAVLQGVRSNYQTDLFTPIVAGFRERSADGPETPDRQRSINVLSDHLRGASFLIAEGVRPSNETRGYVLRRVIRRAAIHGRRLGLQGGLAAGVGDLVEVMSDVYPELAEHQAMVERTLRQEEEAFERTLEAGAERLEALLAKQSTVADEDAFKLYDTYGLPIELTVEMAQERGATVDMPGFDAALTEQRDRSQKAAKRVGFEAGTSVPVANFVGYETLGTMTNVVQIGMSGGRHELHQGEDDFVVIDPTPFYAQAGGQTGDTGTLKWDGGSASVLDSAYARGGDARISSVRVETGVLTVGQTALAAVDGERRAQVARHHSATHLLHKALRDVLGPTVVQRGSYVGPEYTTFDFSFDRALTPAEIATVEGQVNAAIRHNYQRDIAVMPIAEAKKTGAVAIFDEKYGDTVRVIDFGGWARELCGGTHVERSGDIGAAIITAESSIGQGIRRIEMVVGEAAEQRWRNDLSTLRDAARSLKARPEEVPQRISHLQQQIAQLNRDLGEARRGAGGGVSLSAATLETVGHVEFASLLVDVAADGDAIADSCDRLFAERLSGEGVAVVIGTNALAVKVGTQSQVAGLRAGDLVRMAAELTGAKGGGRPDFARGGIKEAAKRNEALSAIRDAVGKVGVPS